MNRAGQFVKNLSGEAEYFSFKPTNLPPEPAIQIDGKMTQILLEANRNLIELDAAAKYIPDVNLFISMYVRQEALISSQIEGTQCTLDDILDPENESHNLDVSEVINYISACHYALDRLKNFPLCNRFFCEIHHKLMNHVRGQEKSPGEFRKTQNWIGGLNCSLKEARYIPPNVEDMNAALFALEKFINENQDDDALIRIALIHYQFETIHPFLDGNGRVGRLIILLYLMEQGLLSKPVIYISYFLKKNQVEYYDRISEVRRSGNYEQWIYFFLEAVSAAAKDSLQSIEALVKLHQKNLKILPKSNRQKNTIKMVFDYLEMHPIIEIKRIASDLQISFNTASHAIQKLQALGILKETTNALRKRVYSYEEYLKILRKDT